VDENEFFTFACILRGDVGHLEEVRDILKEYAAKGHIKIVRVTYSADRMFIVSE